MSSLGWSEAAVSLAVSGLRILPVGSNKAPLCAKGIHAATNDPKAVRDFWIKHPSALIGVAMGDPYDCLDVDPRNGGEEWLEKSSNLIPRTFTYQTRSGGRHIWFKHFDDLRNSCGKIAKGIDIKTTGGYAIGWFAMDYPILDNSPVSNWTTELLELVRSNPPSCPIDLPVVSYGRNESSYAQSALKLASRVVATAPNGTRNDTLNREAYSLLRFVKSQELSIQEIANTLAISALQAGLSGIL